MQTKSKAALRQPGRFGGNEKGHLLGSEHRQNDSGTWPLPVWGLQATFSSTQKRGCAPQNKMEELHPHPIKGVSTAESPASPQNLLPMGQSHHGCLVCTRNARRHLPSRFSLQTSSTLSPGLISHPMAFPSFPCCLCRSHGVRKWD